MKKLTLLALCFAIMFCLMVCKTDDCAAAEALSDSGDYAAAQAAVDYEAAVALYDSGDYAAAASAFIELGDYMDSAERAAAAEERIFIHEATEKLLAIEDFASTQMDEYNTFLAEIDAVEGEDYIAAEITDYYKWDRLMSYPKWAENYALYLRIIEKDSEERIAIAERFKRALGDIEELRFYLTLNLVSHIELLEEIVSHVQTLGFSDKVGELNKEIMQLRYRAFYEMTLLFDPDLEQEMAQIAIFPDSEVKTIAEQALSFWQEFQLEGSLTRERVERVLSLSDEIDDVVASLQDMQQPDYYLKNCLAALAHAFDGYGDDYRDQCVRSMKENMTPELEAYYADTSAEAAPIEITGDDLYIASFTYMDTGHNLGTSSLMYDIYNDSNAHTQLTIRTASKPEEARYLINFSGTTSHYSTYYYDGTDRVTKAYKVNVTLYLKDCKTGDILFTQSFSANPPHSISVYSIPAAYYAYVSWDESFDEFIPLLLSTLGIE
jgi:hypothetical protein